MPRKDGTIYVVEAVPDTKAKTLFVVTAYKKTEASETTHANNVDLGETSKNENQSISATNSIPQSVEESQEGLRDTLSEDAKGAFDIAMESATDKNAAATEFKIKYLEGKTGENFVIDANSELTPSMQKAAYKYGAEAAKTVAEDTTTDSLYNPIRATGDLETKSYNQKAGTLYVEDGVAVTTDLVKISKSVAKDLQVPVSIVKTLGGTRGYYITDSGGIVVAADATVKIKDKDGKYVVLKGTEAAQRIILGHELTHRLKAAGGDAFTKFEQFVRANVANVDKVVAKYMKALDLDETAAFEELVCDYAMINLFSDAKLAKEITTKHSRIAEIIRDFFEWVKAKLGINGKELSNIEYAARLWNDAYSASVRNAKSGAETKNTADGDVKYSINSTFETAYDNWIDKYNRKNDMHLLIGTTSEALKSIGVKEHNIYWHTQKINESLKKHSELNDEIMKQVPDILENPILVLESNSIDAKVKHPDSNRIVMFGEVYGTDGHPIMAVLELEPKSKKGIVLEQMRLVSTYTKTGKSNNTQSTQNLINDSRILYIEPQKNRTNAWLRRNRLQLPFGVTKYGSINKISYRDDFVNTQYMQNSQNDASTDKESTTGTEEFLFESEAEKAQYVADSFDLSGVENYKAVGSMERMSGIANSITKAHRVSKEGRVKLAHALEKRRAEYA